MNLWAFRFTLFYLCIMLVQPQNRFTFLWPLHIADLSFVVAVALHLLSCLQERRFPIRFGPATVLGLCLLFFAMLSQYFGLYQVSPAWNSWVDLLVKNTVLLILLEAMLTSVRRVWALQMVLLVATVWWVKSGLSLSAAGATYSGDRLMGAAVGLIENPNGFAYMMCLFLPLYLYTYQQAKKWWERYLFLALALAAVFIIFQTGSRTGLVTLCAMAVFLLPRYGRHHFKGLLLMAVAVAVFLPMSGEKNIQRFKTIPQSIESFLGKKKDHEPRSLTQDEQSADERQMKNKHTWALIKKYPLFGVGINPDESRFYDEFPMAAGQTHCEILMAGRQMGFIGMGLYAGFWLVMLVGGQIIRKRAKNEPVVRDLGWTFQLQAVALLVGGSFSPLPWHAPMMVLAASASALSGLLRQEETGGDAASGLLLPAPRGP